MIVFKTTFQIVKKYKFTILLYTLLLVFFTGINFSTSEQSESFVAEKPDVFIVNNDDNNKITNNLIEYIGSKCNIKDIELDDEKISDALFYRDVNYVIFIPKNYRNDFMNGMDPMIEVKSTGDYESSLAEMILNKYLRVANIYQKSYNDEEVLISNINETLKEETKVEVTSKLNADELYKATFYFNFLNYSILASCVYVLCLVLAAFKSENVQKRTFVSSIKSEKLNANLLFSNAIVAMGMWCLYILLSFILLGKIMFTYHGLFYILNSFLFTLVALTIAFLIGNLVKSKDAMNGVINVVALGSSFLCGAFVPMEYLPDFLLNIVHVLPSYWFIKTNEMVAKMETFDFETLKPVLVNMIVLLLFAFLFIFITNWITRKKRKIN